MAKQAAHDHQQILDAIKAHDAELARQLMLRHLKYFEEQLRARTQADHISNNSLNPSAPKNGALKAPRRTSRRVSPRDG
jgi:hypothetical protein